MTIASAPSAFLAQQGGLPELGLTVTLLAICFTFAAPLISLPGGTTKDKRLTARGWLVIFLTILALLAQATQEYLQQAEARARAVAVDEGFARLESKLSAVLATTSPVGAKALPGDVGSAPAFGPPIPGEDPLPDAIRTELNAIREMARR